MDYLVPSFASRSIPVHLLRGCGAFLAMACAAWLIRTGHSLAMLGAVPAGLTALVLLRGCPMCWLVGLAQTVADRGRRIGARSAGSRA